MNEQNYSNREIREFLSEMKGTLTRIENQTVKTNGRVSNLENWRAYSTGAIAVIVLVVVPVLGWVLYEVVKLQASK